MTRPFLALVLLLPAGCATPGANGPAAPVPTATSLAGTRWVLTELAGGPVADGVESTLGFLESGKIGGRGGCNPFSGRVEFLGGGAVRVAPLAVTRMACPPAQMDQETRYLAALTGAVRIARDGADLLVHGADAGQPLRFAPAAP